ncbi:MAG: hypothetical protein NW237_08760 [Cyanobacteriota bacterium]|nr:hypothetical protein [Cyanobacteriota bacterium]
MNADHPEQLEVSQEPFPSIPLQQGDPLAIQTWLNQQLTSRDLTITAKRQGQELRLLLESPQLLGAEPLTTQIQELLKSLQTDSIAQVWLYGKQLEDPIPNWHSSFELPTDLPAKPPSKIELAKQGDPQAFQQILDYLLLSEGCSSKIHLNRQVGSMQVIIQGEEVPDQARLTDLVYKTLTRLDLKFVKKLRIAGQKRGSFFPSWSGDLDTRL